jgi:hypothetical protein
LIFRILGDEIKLKNHDKNKIKLKNHKSLSMILNERNSISNKKKVKKYELDLIGIQNLLNL